MSERVVTELIIDASGSVAGAGQYISAMKAAEKERDRVSDSENKVRLAQEKTVATMTGYGNSIARVRADFEKLRGTADPLFAAQIRHNRDLEKAVTQTTAAIRRGVTTEVEGAATISAIRARQLAEINAMKAAQSGARSSGYQQANTANLAAQFQDIAVTSAMGMSPLQIALQQGTQISAVLGPMGAAGAVKSLGAAFMSVISPVSLLTIGLVAAGAAVIQYFMNWKTEARSVDDILAKHEQNIRRLGPAYEDVTKKVKGYSTDPNVVALMLGGDAADLRQKITDEIDAALSGTGKIFARSLTDELGNETFSVAARFKPFFDMIKEFSDDAEAGTPDVIGFQKAVAALAAEKPEFATVGAELAGFVDEAVRAAQRLPEFANGVDMSKVALAAMQEQIDSINPFGLSGRLADLDRTLDALFVRVRAGDIDVDGLTAAMRDMAAFNPDLSGPIEEIARLGLEALKTANMIDGLVNRSTSKGDRPKSMDQLQKEFQDAFNLARRMGDIASEDDPSAIMENISGKKRIGSGIRTVDRDTGIGATRFQSEIADATAAAADYLDDLANQMPGHFAGLGNTFDSSIQSVNDLIASGVFFDYASIADAVRTGIVSGMAQERQQYSISTTNPIQKQINELQEMLEVAGSVAARGIREQIRELELELYLSKRGRALGGIGGGIGGQSVTYAGKFAEGGSFVVPGPSSGDKNRVVLDANGGERVTVSRGGEGSRPPVIINQTYQPAPGETERTTRQNMRNMTIEAYREVGRI